MLYLFFSLLGFLGGFGCGMAFGLVLTRDVQSERQALSDSHVAELLSYERL